MQGDELTSTGTGERFVVHRSGTEATILALVEQLGLFQAFVAP